MKTLSLSAAAALCLFVACSHTGRTPTSARIKLANEATAAFNRKDYATAQAKDEHAVRLEPGFAEAWVGYGMASARLGQTNRARRAYERALSLYEKRRRQNPSDANPVSQQIFLLVLLGRPGDAQALLQHARTNYPNDRQISTMEAHLAELGQGMERFEVRPGTAASKGRPPEGQ
jgi:Flp pilus assembly protein TadD